MKKYVDGKYFEMKEEEIKALENTPKLPYEQMVVSLIREKYTVDDELAILRQRDAKADEFVEYNAFCEECKAKAREYNTKESEV